MLATASATHTAASASDVSSDCCDALHAPETSADTFIDTSADTSADSVFSEASFRAHLLNYLCVLSCKFIGDDVAYIRYMQKQAASHNEHAIAGVRALHFIESIHRAIDESIQHFAATGHARIVQVRLHDMPTSAV